MRVSIAAAGMAALISLAGITTAAQAGKIVVNNDEWTFTDLAFSWASPDTAKFAENIANYFAGGTGGNFLVYSNNQAFTGSSLASTVSGAGHNWTVDTAIPFTLSALSVYDGIFITAFPHAADTSVMIDYVNNGGSIYLAGGTGSLGATGEAAVWNPFLNAFGLTFDGAADYNMVSGIFPVEAGFFLTKGVDDLFYSNGLTVKKTGTLQYPYTQIFGYANGFGALAIYDSEGIPEAGGLALLGAGLIGLGISAQRQRRRHLTA